MNDLIVLYILVNDKWMDGQVSIKSDLLSGDIRFVIVEDLHEDLTD